MSSIVPHKQEFPLTPEDRKKIKRHLIPILVFAGIAIIFFTFMYSFIVEDMGNPFANGEIFGYFFAVFALFFFGIIGYILWTTLADLKGGHKFRITGEVTDKRLNVVTSNNTGNRQTTSSTKRYYYLYVDTIEYPVDYQNYNKAKVGDKIIMDIGPKSNIVFDFTITQHVAENESISKSAEQRAFISAEVLEIPLVQADYTALYNQYVAALNSKIIWMIFPLLIIVPLLVSGMGVFLVFLFPIVIIFIVQVVGAVKLRLHYQKSKAYGKKEVITEIVRDKSTQTSNRSRHRNIIHTINHSITVNEQVYDLLKTGDKILIFKGKYINQPLSIMTLDKKEHYLS